MDYSSYEFILIEVEDGVALLTLNRPEALNATNFGMHNELTRIWGDLGRDPEVRGGSGYRCGQRFLSGRRL